MNAGLNFNAEDAEVFAEGAEKHLKTSSSVTSARHSATSALKTNVPDNLKALELNLGS